MTDSSKKEKIKDKENKKETEDKKNSDKINNFEDLRLNMLKELKMLDNIVFSARRE